MTKIQQTGDKVLANVERVIVGKHQEVRLALVAILHLHAAPRIVTVARPSSLPVNVKW
jgi:hypothetical protein